MPKSGGIFHHAVDPVGGELVRDVLRGRSGIRVYGINRVRVVLSKIEKETYKQLQWNINTSLMAIAHSARLRAPFKTGKLVNSIRVERARLKRRKRIEGRVKAWAPYAAWVEFGTWKQSKKSKKAAMPPARPGDPLFQWAQAAGIKPFLVARAIGRPVQRGRVRNVLGFLTGRRVRARTQGTAKQPFLGPAFVAERPKFYRRVLSLLDFARGMHRRVPGARATGGLRKVA